MPESVISTGLVGNGELLKAFEHAVDFTLREDLLKRCVKCSRVKRDK